MFVQRRDRHLRVLGQPGLGREAAEVRVMSIAEEPQNDLGGRLQPALLDGPIGRAWLMARASAGQGDARGEARDRTARPAHR